MISFDAYVDEMSKISGVSLDKLKGALSGMKRRGIGWSDPKYKALQSRIDAKAGGGKSAWKRNRLFHAQERAASRSRFGSPYKNPRSDPWAPKSRRSLPLAGPVKALP